MPTANDAKVMLFLASDASKFCNRTVLYGRWRTFRLLLENGIVAGAELSKFSQCKIKFILSGFDTLFCELDAPVDSYAKLHPVRPELEVASL